MEQQRGLYRVAVEFPGYLSRGTEVTACDVVDLTEHGFRIRTSLPAAAGDELTLEFNLRAGCPIQCVVQISHSAPPYLGSRIVAISPEHHKQLSQFVEQLISLNLRGF